MKLSVSYFLWLAVVMVTCSHSEDPEVKVTDLKLVMDLPDELIENSGLIYYQGLLWNINDGGNEASIYGINPAETSVKRKVVIKGAVNTDWEDISQDEAHIYIGDFGNNLGDRKDLRIYIADKADLTPGADSIPVTGIIEFSYENQTDFTPAENYTTPWDCEAFIVGGDSIVVFTKNWQANTTSLYTMPAKAGNYKAHLRKIYDLQGLVTSAAYNATTHELLVLGYQNYNPFIVEKPNFDLSEMSFQGSKKTLFTNMIGTQTEGIAYGPSDEVYVTCEKSPLVNQKLFRLER
jgi:hypothetical protein